jgi:hypothetical protein
VYLIHYTKKTTLSKNAGKQKSLYISFRSVERVFDKFIVQDFILDLLFRQHMLA